MGWIEALRGRIVAVDTAPFIYLIEENSTYLEMVCSFFSAMDRGEFRAVTSTITLLEVLIYPLRRHDVALAQQYREILLCAEGLTTVPLFPEIAEEGARLRAQYNITTPDAVQMATAIYEGASFFLTNDAGLPSLPMLKVLVLEELRKGA